MRRRNGSGSVYYLAGEGHWCAKVTLEDGRTVRRARHSEKDAKAALDELLIEYANQLGYYYHMPRAYYYEDRPRKARRAINLSVRFRVLERALHVDHVIPIACGGTDDETNLVAACAECNRGKADSVLR